ncbi:uracil-xanthine permease family protein [Ferruginivarius sediminum]|uniref:Uracil permease n=1 Tax=Ferruginivarius sediminum TaxID=2661937 RepID=A0A369T602_9PROT|nr:solute carrier family 23 protein [Ferruginivarius sediminum]RDD60749.1 uracil permease [Ferruginivarius sediminum]
MSEIKSHEPGAQPGLDLHERPAGHRWLVLSVQHLFAMFGATILVPLLTGLNPAVALVTSGLGTLAYIAITKGGIPAYLGSSFAFIAPIVAGTELAGPDGALVGAFAAGCVYLVVSLLIGALGVNWLLRLLPPVVVGPVIMVIGLSLASVAIDMATNDPATESYSALHFGVALATLAVTILAAVFLRGFFAMVPVLIGIVAGYIIALAAGLVDMSGIWAAETVRAPDFIVPFVTHDTQVPAEIFLLLVPVAVVTIAEHIGDQLVISKVIGRNVVKSPGLHRSLAGDGVATMIASCLGGPPNTTYGENIGVLAITRVFSVWVIGGAAVLAVLLGFLGNFAAFLNSIPTAVMGGVSILLFGIIASSGLRTMIEGRVNLGEKRNLAIVSVILVIGVGGAVLPLGELVELSGMALAAIVGILLNLILPGKHLTGDIEEVLGRG